jgi:pSer/pThr/pTyr-binding forkhead associated (FHA) protein
MLVDLGKVVHYQFDKVTHSTMPSQKPSQNFQILRPSDDDYTVEMDENDPPTLRARPTWVSSDENKDLIQKEIILEADAGHMYHTIGRSMKRMVQIKLKAVSADHAKIGYNPEKGWFITEQGKDKLSSNGTFVFMKSLGQIAEHQPSDLIPLHDGMVISFINYELRVNLEKKDESEVKEQEMRMNDRHYAQMSASHKMGETMAAATPAQIHKEEVVEAQPEVVEQQEPVMAAVEEIEQPKSARAATPEVEAEAPAEGEGQVPEEPVEEAQPEEDKKADEPVQEEAQQEQVEEPVAEDKVEEPAVEEKAEEPAAEEKVEEPAAEEKADEPVE